MRHGPFALAAGAAVLVTLSACGTPPRTAGPITPSPEPAGQASSPWSANATAHRGEEGEEFDYTCPPEGTARTVWGTDVYTDDSSVCTAAVHAGIIDFESGGTVTIVMGPGEDSYEGTERNGVTSNDYGAWHGSFTFSEDD